MRSSVLLASVFAFGAIANPLEKRYLVTEVEVEWKTVTVYVTPGQAIPTQGGHAHGGHGNYHTRKTKTPAYTPAPQPTYAPAPPPPKSSSQKPAPPPVQSQSPPPPSGGHKSGAIQATFSSGEDYKNSVLFHHNQARANHGAGPLVWDASCEANARLAAERCSFQHYIPSGAGQGQNLFTHSGGEFNVTAAITESWYKGEFKAMEPYWGAENIPSSVFPSVGHLTALLWKATTKVGCVSIDCGSRMTVGGSPSNMNKYTVCNYASAGNMGGQYGKQVGAPISRTDLGSWLD